MAWPPPVLAVNRTNATPQLDTHAADHNALALAVNDIVARLANASTGWITHAVAPTLSGTQAAPLDDSTEWLGMDIAWPTWAKFANITTSLHDINVTAADSLFKIRVRVGAVGATGGVFGADVRTAPGSTAGTITGLTWTDRVALTGLGSFRYSILVGRIVGTAGLQAGTHTSLRFQVIYEQ